MKKSIFERQSSYELFDYKLMPGLPVVIRLNGKNFTRFTKMLKKPFSPEICKIMAEASLYSISEFQGAVIGFTFSDEVNFILNPPVNAEPWFDYRIQKMNSISASTFTDAFKTNELAHDIEIPVIGNAIFDCRVFSLPNVAETVNYLISRQLIAGKQAIHNALLAELTEKHGVEKAESSISNKTTDEKKAMLLKHCGIDFEDYYPGYYYKGISVYRVPTTVSKEESNIVRNKWTLDWETPFFIDTKDFLTNIIISGKDSIRV